MITIDLELNPQLEEYEMFGVLQKALRQATDRYHDLDRAGANLPTRTHEIDTLRRVYRDLVLLRLEKMARLITHYNDQKREAVAQLARVLDCPEPTDFPPYDLQERIRDLDAAITALITQASAFAAENGFVVKGRFNPDTEEYAFVLETLSTALAKAGQEVRSVQGA